jgi:4-amino-4-deoxy-L-arabinose transferase-like glycosyltransferase
MSTLVQGPAAANLPGAALRPQGTGFFASRGAVVFLFCFSAALYLGTAFYPSLLDDADSSHAVVAREMLTRGDYVTMYMNGIRYLMKAPLHYWLVAFSYRIFGQNAFATRLPVALSMVTLVLLLYEFGRRFFSAKVGFYAALVVASSVGMFIFTRIMIPEAIYALLFTAAFYLFLRAWTHSLDQRTGYWGGAAMIGLAVLTRGLVGLVFPAAVIFFFVLLTGGLRRWRELRLLSCTLIVLAIALPWHILAEMRSPGFLWSFIVNEHFNRALGTRWPPDYDAVPLWLWWLEHLAWFFPWSVFVGFALKQFVPIRRWLSLRSAEEQARVFLFIWAALILLFFSVVGGSRMEYYSFGAWPAIALLLGLGLARAEEANRRSVLRVQTVLAISGIVLAAALLLLVAKSFQVQKQDIATLVTTHENDFYRVSMAHIFDLTPQAFADLRIPATLAAIAFGGAFGIAWIMRRRGRALGATLAMAAGMAMFFSAADIAYGAFQPLLSSRQLADQINRYLRPQDQVAIYGDFDDTSSVAFYSHRRVWIYDGLVNNLVFGSKYRDAPHIFLNDAEFGALWKQPERVFLVVPELQRSVALPKLEAEGAWIFAQLGGKIVLTNQPIVPTEPKLMASR